MATLLQRIGVITDPKDAHAAWRQAGPVRRSMLRCMVHPDDRRDERNTPRR